MKGPFSYEGRKRWLATSIDEDRSWKTDVMCFGGSSFASVVMDLRHAGSVLELNFFENAKKLPERVLVRYHKRWTPSFSITIQLTIDF